jgi:amino acid transporter
LTVFITQLTGINLEVLKNEGYPALGTLVGGRWLGGFIAVGGMASALGLYSSVLLSVSRVPKVMSDDHLLPAKLHELHPRFKTPWISILCCSLIVSFMILWTFEDLLIIDVTLYGAALLLEFITLIILRVKAPAVHRPFKIPLGITALCLMVLLPLSVYTVAVSAAFINTGKSFMPIVFAVICLASAELIWRIIEWIHNRKDINH